MNTHIKHSIHSVILIIILSLVLAIGFGRQLVKFEEQLEDKLIQVQKYSEHVAKNLAETHKRMGKMQADLIHIQLLLEDYHGRK